MRACVAPKRQPWATKPSLGSCGEAHQTASKGFLSLFAGGAIRFSATTKLNTKASSTTAAAAARAHSRTAATATTIQAFSLTSLQKNQMFRILPVPRLMALAPAPELCEALSRPHSWCSLWLFFVTYDVHEFVDKPAMQRTSPSGGFTGQLRSQSSREYVAACASPLGPGVAHSCAGCM